MTRLPASVIKHVHLAKEPFMLPQDEARRGERAPLAAMVVASAEPEVIPASLTLVDPAHLRQEGYQEGFDTGLHQGQTQAADEMESNRRECRHQIEEAQAAGKAFDVQAAKAEAGARELDDKVRLLNSAFLALNQAKADVLNTAEDDLIALCFSVATQVFEQAAVSPEFLSSLVRRAIGELGRSPSVVVHVHPQDLDWLKQAVEPPSHGAQALQWLADPAVELGGCIVHSEQAALDARLEQQVEALRQRLLQIRNQRQPTPGAQPSNPATISAASAGVDG